MASKIHIAILEDHPSTVDGYRYRLESQPDMVIVAVARDYATFKTLLAQEQVDVVLLDAQVPAAPDNRNPYPVLNDLPLLLQRHPDLSVLVITMFKLLSLIELAVEMGASGYILKDDAETLGRLAEVVREVAKGGIYFSSEAEQLLASRQEDAGLLTRRQLQALSLCAAYPNRTMADLAKELQVAHSTMRNVLSQSYLALGVRSRQAAVEEARRRGLLPPAEDAGVYSG